MRVLFSTTGGSGHFGPLIPIARACAAAGHTVAVAAPRSFGDKVAAAGFDLLPFDDVPAHVLGEVFGRLTSVPREEADRTVITEVFGRLSAQAALPALLTETAAWGPDIVVREPLELASLVAAGRAGIPQVSVAIGMGRLGPDFVALLSEALADLSLLAGLPADRGAELFLSSDTFTSVPALLDDEPPAVDGPSPNRHSEGAVRVWRFRDGALRRAGSLPGEWGNAEDPLVYVSFGSVTATVGPFGAIYSATLRALAELPVRVLLTTGEGLDPATVEPIPDNAWVERWWPQADVMPQAAVSIGHGGFGTTMLALAAGVPQLVVPLFAFDQYVNAGRISQLGAGLQVLGGVDGSDQIPAALDRLLTEPHFSHRAQVMAAEIEALPDVATCPAVLEQLAGLSASR